MRDQRDRVDEQRGGELRRRTVASWTRIRTGWARWAGWGPVSDDAGTTGGDAESRRGNEAVAPVRVHGQVQRLSQNVRGRGREDLRLQAAAQHVIVRPGVRLYLERRGNSGRQPHH